MTLAAGRHFLSIPGPSVIPDRVLNAMHRGAPNIYEGPLIEATDHVFSLLADVACTKGKPVMYISNGHGAWEAALVNTLSRGDRVLVLATGRFAFGWGEMASGLGIEVEVLDFGHASPVEMTRVEERLRADKAHTFRAVMMVQTDTSTSVRNDVRGVRQAMDAAGHPALLMVDCIASLASDRYEMDAWGADVTVAGSQKGLMTPPGLGLNFVSERALAARQSAGLATPYWDWVPRIDPEVYYLNFAGTAPTHHIFGLDAALSMIFEEGLEAVWARHATLARAVHMAVKAWGAEGPLRLNIDRPGWRSNAVTTIRCDGVNPDTIRAHCERRFGVTLGIGLALGGSPETDPERSVFRIGHMGHVNAPMVMGTLGALDATLKALKIPHGQGALDAASACLSDT